jgi:3-oxoacyl-[acyl-carrier protein] reductase
MPLEMSLADRIALVTGAGRGAGEAMARLLAEQGAAVAVNDLHEERARTVAAAIAAAGGRAHPVPFDVTRYADVQAGIAEIERALGPVDILVNNAGMPDRSAVRKHIPFAESTPEDWQVWIDLNAYGQMHCMRTVLPGMCERGWGRVVQISSGLASRGLANNESLLGMSKASIEGLIRNVAIEVARSGVTVNALALGLLSNAGDHADPDVVARTLDKVPMGRFGEPREAAAAVAFLASVEAGFITGQVIHVNGGSFQGR